MTIPQTRDRLRTIHILNLSPLCFCFSTMLCYFPQLTSHFQLKQAWFPFPTSGRLNLSLLFTNKPHHVFDRVKRNFTICSFMAVLSIHLKVSPPRLLLEPVNGVLLILRKTLPITFKGLSSFIALVS